VPDVPTANWVIPTPIPITISTAAATILKPFTGAKSRLGEPLRAGHLRGVPYTARQTDVDPALGRAVPGHDAAFIHLRGDFSWALEDSNL